MELEGFKFLVLNLISSFFHVLYQQYLTPTNHFIKKMRADSTDQYVTRYTKKFEGLSHTSKNLQPEECNKRENQEDKHVQRAKTQKKSFHQSFKTRMQLSSQTSSIGKLSERIKSEGYQYGRFFDQVYEFQEKLNWIKEAILKKKQRKQNKDALRAKIKSERIKLAKQRGNKRSLIPMKSKHDISQYFSSEMHAEKRPSFRLQRLGGLVITELQFEGRPFKQDPYNAKNNVYYVSEVIKGIQDPDSLVFEHIRNSIQFLSILQYYAPPAKPEKYLNLPVREGYKGKKTIIFDLDETLIHCTQTLDQEHDIELPVIFPNGDLVYAGINIRPGVKQMLSYLYQKCQVIVFTASHPCYANVVIDYLDPQKKYIHHRLYREHCYLIPNGPYVKDIRIINRPMSKMVLIDNAAYSYCFQVDNGIPIIPYYSGTKDFELNALKRYLDRIMLCQDVRRVNWETFKLYKYKDFTGEQCMELVDELYSHKTQKQKDKQMME